MESRSTAASSIASSSSRVIWEDGEPLQNFKQRQYSMATDGTLDANEAFYNQLLSKGEHSTSEFIPLARHDGAYAELPVSMLDSSTAIITGR